MIDYDFYILSIEGDVFIRFKRNDDPIHHNDINVDRKMINVMYSQMNFYANSNIYEENSNKDIILPKRWDFLMNYIGCEEHGRQGF
jgi:hypothetical protein